MQSVAIHPSYGFSLEIPKEELEGNLPLPVHGSYVYTLWNEKAADGPRGRYLAKVLSVDTSGKRSRVSIEIISLIQSSGFLPKGMGNGPAIHHQSLLHHSPQRTAIANPTKSRDMVMI